MEVPFVAALIWTSLVAAAETVPANSGFELGQPGPFGNVMQKIDAARNCDHQCEMVRKPPTDDGQWESVLDAARSRWQKWLASEP